MVLWVLIANSSSAEIFEVCGRGKNIQKIHHIDYPDGREKGSKILTDRPGRSSEGPQGGSTKRMHALGSETDVHLHEIDLFAHQIIKLLEKSNNDQSFTQLAIISPPQFLGVFRPLLNSTLKSKVVKEINKAIPASISDNEKIEMFCRLLEIDRPAYTPSRNSP